MENRSVDRIGPSIAPLLQSPMLQGAKRPYAVPPGTPEDRVKILRQAFLKALKSPKLQKDAKRQGVIVAPISGQEVTKTIQKLSKLTQSNPEILNRYKELAGVK